jgi:hypothetical protein
LSISLPTWRQRRPDFAPPRYSAAPEDIGWESANYVIRRHVRRHSKQARGEQRL